MAETPADPSMPDAPRPAAAPRPPARADWVMGSGEGLEDSGARGATPAPAPRPVLRRPDEGVPAPQPAIHRVIDEGASAATRDAEQRADFAPGLSWVHAEQGVPRLPDLPPAPAPAPAPRVARDFPMDDAEEGARANAEAIVVAAASVAHAHDIVGPEEFEVREVRVPWWVHVVHTLRFDRRLRIVGVVVLCLWGVAMWWPRGDRPVHVANIRRHAAKLDGTHLAVHGRVGEVFHVGQGWAYYLLDGRDTLVVFTRAGEPHERDDVTVRGMLSTGWLDGQPTLALFVLGER